MNMSHLNSYSKFKFYVMVPALHKSPITYSLFNQLLYFHLIFFIIADYAFLDSRIILNFLFVVNMDCLFQAHKKSSTERKHDD